MNEDRGPERPMAGGLIVYVIVLLSLQVFLLTVALDGLLGRQPRLAWVSAGLSVLIFAGSAMFYRLFRGRKS